jgi:AraC-like DNA-binding protein
MRKTRKSDVSLYRWEVGCRLVNEVRARDVEAAERSLQEMLGMFAEIRGNENFDEIKLRMVQAHGIASRAAYDSGANPDHILQLSITIMRRLIHAKSIRRLAAVSRDGIRKLVRLVPDTDRVAETKIDRAIHYIREHITEDISRETVARLLRCSPSHLSHLFTRLTGHTFKQYILVQRMEVAKRLLGKTSTRIADVAFEVGYDDPNYFSYAFRRVTGVSPLRYRRRIASPDK